MADVKDIIKSVSQAVEKAQESFSLKVVEDMKVRTPVDTTRMRETPAVKGENIRYTVPYALYQWRGINPHTGLPLHYQSPTAVDHWFEPTKEEHLEEWKEFIRKEIIDGYNS